MTKKKKTSLGWLQQHILTLLWDREMYGQEIQRNLGMRGKKVGPGQLYPALRTLEEMEALTSRNLVGIEESKEQGHSTNRKYYTVTDSGKRLLLHDLTMVFRLLEIMVAERADYVFDDIPELADIIPGAVVVDFSPPHLEYARMKLAPMTAPTGRYFITAENRDQSNMLRERIELIGLEESVTVLERQKKTIPLPDKSVDVALILFKLHEDGSEWMLKEMSRILKDVGKGVIIDTVSLKDHILEEIIPQFLPGHSRTGIDLDSLLPLLKENKLQIVFEKKERGILYLVLSKKK